MKMTEAASQQALEEGKRRLREFLESSDTGRQAMAMSASASSNSTEQYEMVDMKGKTNAGSSRAEEDDLDDI